MLQRYDISMHGKANHISIKEFVAPVKNSRRRDYFETTKEKYSLTHKVDFDGDSIHAAIANGKEALITELRSDGFYPIRPCVEIIAEKVIELSEDNDKSLFEVFFDDKELLPKPDESD